MVNRKWFTDKIEFYFTWNENYKNNNSLEKAYDKCWQFSKQFTSSYLFIFALIRHLSFEIPRPKSVNLSVSHLSISKAKTTFLCFLYDISLKILFSLFNPRHWTITGYHLGNFGKFERPSVKSGMASFIVSVTRGINDSKSEDLDKICLKLSLSSFVMLHLLISVVGWYFLIC